MTDFGTFQQGGVPYPLVASTSNSLLQDADPALFYAIEFYKGVLQLHVQARLAAEAAKWNVQIPQVVRTTLSNDPGQNPLDTRWLFPILAVYRKSERHALHTTTWRRTEGTWGITYLLPALTTLQAELLNPILKSVVDVLRNRTEQGYDPAYNSGQKVWQLAGLHKIAITETHYGNFSVPDGMQFFPGVTMTMQVWEREMPETDFDQLTGIDVGVDLAQPNGDPTVQDVSSFDENFVVNTGGAAALDDATSAAGTATSS